MKVSGTRMRTIWLEPDGAAVGIIDQTLLPHERVTARLVWLDDAAHAIRAMLVRGASLIGAPAAYGVALAMRRDPSDAALAEACRVLMATRPTAVNLRWALDDVAAILKGLPLSERARAALRRAGDIADEDVAINRAIGTHGMPLLRAAFDKKRRGAAVEVLTHCNAGWLATVDWGTALAPIYAAHEARHPLHVRGDQTRPRQPGAKLPAWELQQHGLPHTVIVRNAGGHLMQHGRVDLCITGTDRTTA